MISKIEILTFKTLGLGTIRFLVDNWEIQDFYISNKKNDFLMQLISKERVLKVVLIKPYDKSSMALKIIIIS